MWNDECGMMNVAMLLGFALIQHSSFHILHSKFHFHSFTHFLIAFHDDEIAAMQAFADDYTRARISRDGDGLPCRATVFRHPYKLSFIVD